jgi:hypothetical protein
MMTGTGSVYTLKTDPRLDPLRMRLAFQEVLQQAEANEFRMRGYEGHVAFELVEGYAMNLTQAYLFRRSGSLLSAP